MRYTVALVQQRGEAQKYAGQGSDLVNEVQVARLGTQDGVRMCTCVCESVCVHVCAFVGVYVCMCV